MTATTTRREQILAFIASALEDTEGVSGRVYRSRVEAFSRNEAPAVIIEPGPDRAQVYATCKLDWTMDVLVVVHTRGQITDQLASDSAGRAQQAHGRPHARRPGY